MKKQCVNYRIPVILMLCLQICATGYGQIVTSAAGTGTATFGGDGASAALASLNLPQGVATDNAGNVYIADSHNHRVRKISTTGIITTIAGTGVSGYNGDGILATTAQLGSPFDVAIDDTGNIYIGDETDNRIRKINTSGIISTVAGTGVAGFSGEGGPATAAKISGASVYWGYGHLYVADGGNHRIRKIDDAGNIITIAGNGSGGYTGDGVPATTTGLYYPGFLCMDKQHNLYISDNGNHRIRKVDTFGIITTFAGNGIGTFGGDSGPATSASIHFPAGIAIDNDGNFYIADYSNNRVRRINTAGIISTFAGTGTATWGGDSGPASGASFNGPCDISFDPCGKIYIADLNNNRVRKIDYANRSTAFTLGASVTMTVCMGVADTTINSKLAIHDSDLCQAETWSVVTAPGHGSLGGFTAVSSSVWPVTYPAGLSYTSAAGYHGADTFKVRVSDGSLSDTILVYVTVDSLPYAGVIAGIDSVCPGHVVTLTDAVTGGVWSSTGTSLATVSAAGVVSGVNAGTVTIRYTYTNACGADTASYSVKVRSVAICNLSETAITQPAAGCTIYPNPGNGLFTVHITSAADEDATVTVTDVIGKKVHEFMMSTNRDHEMRLNILPGVYFLSVQLHNEKYATKIVVE